MLKLPETFCRGFHNEDVVKEMRYCQLGSTDLSVSVLSFGGSGLGRLHGTPNEIEGIETVKKAIKKGINLIDTAPWYGFGMGEMILGKALQDIPRKAYYLSTKVGRYRPDYLHMFDFSAERTRQSVNESLKKLRLDYLDIVQVHDVEFAPNINVIVNETLPALEQLKQAGKLKYIGITGYSLTILKEVLLKSHIKIDVVISYCRLTLFDDTLIQYIPFFNEHNVGIMNAGVFGMGLLVQSEIPKWHPVTDEIREACLNSRDYCRNSGVNIAKLALHFAMHCSESIPTHLIGMITREQLKSNLEWYHNNLTPKEQEVLEYIREKFFKPLVLRHWEGREITKYRKALHQETLNKSTD